MGIKYVGNVANSVHGRQKRQNITRWMYIPQPKYKPTWSEILCALMLLVAAIHVVILFVVYFSTL